MKPTKTKNEKTKPVIVEYRSIHPAFKDLDEKWLKWGSYRNESIASEIMEMTNRKHPGFYQMRIRNN